MNDNFSTQRTGFFSVISITLLIVLILALFNQCTLQPQTSYQRIKDRADAIRVINAHEHQHLPEEYGNLTYRFYHLIHHSYLMADVVSAGGTRLDNGPLDSLSLEEHWNINGQALNYTRNTSYYGHFIKGFRKLYDLMIFILRNQISQTCQYKLKRITWITVPGLIKPFIKQVLN